MNKKIYFNNKFILLGNVDPQTSQDQSIKIYTEVNDTFLTELTKDFLAKPDGNSVAINTADSDNILKKLIKMFHYIEAAGGFIHKDTEFLFIHRHNRWDLPKGKLEKNETIKEAAIRECEEECGVKDLRIIHPLSSTFHLYAYKNGFALKQTYWFYMKTDFSETLTPQLEEDIDQVKWFNRQNVESVVLRDTYYTISDIVVEALKIIH